jgi:hypothetical protein
VGLGALHLGVEEAGHFLPSSCIELYRKQGKFSLKIPVFGPFQIVPDGEATGVWEPPELFDLQAF